MHQGKKFLKLDIESFVLKAPENLRIFHISDLHGVWRPDVLRAATRLHPDVAVITGDLFDGVQGPQDALKLVCKLKERMPVLYVPGNHESYRHDIQVLTKVLDQAGIICLDGTSVRIGRICFHGLTDDGFAAHEAQMGALKEAHINDGLYHVLLYHRADHFVSVKDLGFDLVLSGHVHGGQWRIGRHGILGPCHTLFPRYSSGLYKDEGTTLIVSRGLGDHMRIPRIHDMWHLPVIDLRREDSK